MRRTIVEVRARKNENFPRYFPPWAAVLYCAHNQDLTLCLNAQECVFVALYYFVIWSLYTEIQNEYLQS